MKDTWWIVVGSRSLVVFCSNDKAEAEQFASQMVAKVMVIPVDREYQRGDRWY